ncbi:MAG: NifU family protein [Dehalococcoidia bacterium]|nr:NifU family protein [Dehalococcoidia bacterium]
MRERIEKALDKVRPYLEQDGGNVDVMNVSDDGVVELQLQGACSGCPSSVMTLAAGIERVIREEVPEVTEIVTV